MMEALKKMAMMVIAAALAITMVGCDDDDGDGGGGAQAPAAIAGVTVSFNPEITFNADGTFDYDGTVLPDSAFSGAQQTNAGTYLYVSDGKETLIQLTENGTVDVNADGNANGAFEIGMYDYADTDGDGKYDTCSIVADGATYAGSFAAGTEPAVPDGGAGQPGLAPANRAGFIGDSGFVFFDGDYKAEVDFSVNGAWETYWVLLDNGTYGYSNGTYTYNKTGANTANLKMNTEGGGSVVRKLTFTSATEGNWVAGGDWGTFQVF